MVVLGVKRFGLLCESPNQGRTDLVRFLFIAPVLGRGQKLCPQRLVPHEIIPERGQKLRHGRVALFKHHCLHGGERIHHMGYTLGP